jgi:peptidoglycan/LPS O-acetylase OafA/YrhL
MELITAILVAGPLGYFVSPRRRSLIAYLTIWAVVFPIQTIVVHSANPDDIEPLYFAFNALILCLGIGLNYAGAKVRSRRDAATGVGVAN